MAETITIDPERQANLAAIITRLHKGEAAAIVRKDFARLIQGVSASEIAAMEQSLIDGGLPVEEVQRLCDVHVEVFQGELRKGAKAHRLSGHPVHSYLEENRAAKTRIGRLLGEARSLAWGVGDPAAARSALDDLSKILVHYERKENQLFPWLERSGFTGPSKVMWGKHDEIRTQFKATRSALDDFIAITSKSGSRSAALPDAAARHGAEAGHGIEAGLAAPARKGAEALPEAEPRSRAKAFRAEARNLAGRLRRMIFMEERILIPNAVARLSDADWADIRRGEDAIGFAWIEPGAVYDPAFGGAKAVPGKGEKPAPSLSDLIAGAKPGQYDGAGGGTQSAVGGADTVTGGAGTLAGGAGSGAAGDGAIPLQVGALSAALIDLIFKRLPIDLSFVDANDKVAWYSDNPHRVFPRSPGVIGRDVRNCHPPKSLAVVERILGEFREGTKDEARFWIEMGGKFIIIEYFAIRDGEGRYLGTLEASQDATGIRGLSGQRRLLDWEATS
ncbi:MAG: DUF438 domain-containing protein [Treponema sp.]|nr:DUF438 domain-containing protein [Treponema sp.]